MHPGLFLRLLLGLGLTALAAAAVAQPIIEEDIEGPPTTVYVLVNPPQQEMLGTSPDPRNSDYSLLSSLTSVDALGVSAVFTAIRSAMELREKEETEFEGLHTQEINELHFDFQAAVSTIVAGINRSSDWQIYQLETTEFRNPESGISRQKRITRKLLKGSHHIGATLFLEFFYYFSPQFDRIRLLVQAKSFSKVDGSRITTSLNRHYEYLSPSYGTAIRRWREGEREARIQAVEEEYARKVDRFPKNRSAYQKQRKLALRLLSDPERIPPLMAVGEFWDNERLASALETASTVMMNTIERDLRYFGHSDYPESDWEKIDHLDRDGDDTRILVREVDMVGDQVMYQSQGGFIYSLPRQ